MIAAGSTSAQPFPYWPRPETRVGRIALWIWVFVLGCGLARLVLGHGTAGAMFGALMGLGLFALAPFALILLFRLLNTRLLWRVRNRLILTYVLMGLAPVVLFGTLIAIAGYVFAGQFSINSALAGMDEAANQIKSEASDVAGLLASHPPRKASEPLQFEQASNPRETQISVATLEQGVWRNLRLTMAHGSSPASPFDGVAEPQWMHEGFDGAVVWQGKLYLCRSYAVTEDSRSARVLTALELNQATLTTIGHSLGRVLLYSGSGGEGRKQIDGAEREAQSAEEQADLADSQREVQQALAEAQREQAQAQKEAARDVRQGQEESAREIREAQEEAARDIRQAQEESARDIREAQREVERAQAEAARARGPHGSADDQSEAQKDVNDAQQQLREAERQASQAGQAPAVSVPQISVTPPHITPPQITPPHITAPHITPPHVPSPAVASAPPAPPATPNPVPNGSRRPAVSGKAPAADKPTPAAPQQTSGSDTGFVAVSGGVVPTPASFFNPRVYFTAPFPFVDWQAGQKHTAILVVISRPSTLYARLFATSVEAGSVLRNVLFGIAIAFGLLELFALWMATRLSGTITRSVADLYQGTTEIDKGNLQYRVKPQRPDQLGALAGSFNRMAGSIQDLLVQQRESDRLLNELAIAQEVQQNLFPHSPVLLAGLEIHAVCLPARTVSGDYFDFILGHNSLGKGTAACIALGDISGKGISAALLMATLHSAVRAFSLREDGRLPSPARQLELLNQHLFDSTQSNRYATLFLAFYDAQSHRLTYANGGHLPPFLISADGTVRRLDVGGAVVGLLEHMVYQEATVELRPGDLLVAFTDGMSEPENAAEQEFGEARLLTLLEQHSAAPLPQLADSVFEAVKAWIAEQEQPDDMTLLLARQR